MLCERLSKQLYEHNIIRNNIIQKHASNKTSLYKTRLYHHYAIKKTYPGYIEHCKKIVYTQLWSVTKFCKKFGHSYIGTPKIYYYHKLQLF